jgi:hypothetical protein
VQYLLSSPQFLAPSARYARYSWPVEFVVRAIKEVGWAGFSVNDTLTPLANMGQQLFEPPDVNGWGLGPDWFSTGAMLARMNFAASLAFNQRFNLGREATAARGTSQELLDYFLDKLSPPEYDGAPRGALLEYLNAGTAWPGSDTQLTAKAAGLTRLIVGSAEYQLM